MTRVFYLSFSIINLVNDLSLEEIVFFLQAVAIATRINHLHKITLNKNYYYYYYNLWKCMQLVLIKKKNVCFILDLNKQSSSEQIHSKVD